jgi:hypothetical protein
MARPHPALSQREREKKGPGTFCRFVKLVIKVLHLPARRVPETMRKLTMTARQGRWRRFYVGRSLIRTYLIVRPTSPKRSKMSEG